MQTNLTQHFSEDAGAQQAAALLRKCVHCGFCNATCPTFQLLGDELDGPRGRIYLIKEMLEGGDVTRSTQVHLDRCLTCLNCQTTCPSGVEYGRLIDIGRDLVDARVKRPPLERATRWLLREGLTSPWFAPALRLGQAVRWLLPARIKNKVPPRPRPVRAASSGERASNLGRQVQPGLPVSTSGEPRRVGQPVSKVLVLQGCVQPAMLPNIDRAAERVLEAAGIEVLYAHGTGCCGALRTHLSDHAGGLEDMRRNVDAWDAQLAGGGVQAVVSSASACALTLKDYGRYLADDPEYADRAARISALACDLSDLLPQIVASLQGRLPPGDRGTLAFHPPCTLQHGQKRRGVVESQLRSLGFQIALARDESHLCCGSAGAYSILQPQIAGQLRDRKLDALAELRPSCILSANVGCIAHLQSGTATPVKHWIELLDEALI
jgi:glycolate oxidase iron-sulfur subunit